MEVLPGTRYSAGNPAVIAVKVAPVEGGRAVLVVRGKAAGFSDLLLLPPTGATRQIRYQVQGKREGALVRDSQASWSIPGVQFLPAGEGVVARGRAKNLEDFNTAQALLGSARGRALDLTELPEAERRSAEENLRRLFQEAGFSQIAVRGAGREIWISGTVAGKAERELAERMAKGVFPGVVSLLRVPFEQQAPLRFRVQILELLRSGGSRFGLEWSDSVPGIVELQQKLLRGRIQLAATLAALERKGWARVLSQPQLAVNAEGVAELRVGGEIPVHYRSRQESGVHWKPYGLHLRLEVPGVAGDRARAALSVEISTLDPANSLEGVPATRLNRMQTVLDLTLGHTAFLSGLLQEQTAESVRQLPFLGDLPVLGALFRSRDFQRNKSELVIALTAEKEEIRHARAP